MHPEGQRPCTSGQNGILDLIHAQELDPGIYHVVHISTEKGTFRPNQENLNRKKTNLSLSSGHLCNPLRYPAPNVQIKISFFSNGESILLCMLGEHLCEQ